MFGFDKNRFVGIDVGTSAVKIVEIEEVNKKPVLSNYAWVELGQSEGEIKSASFETVLPEYIKRMANESGMRSRDAYVSIPSFGGLITLIEFPPMSDTDLNQAIKYEAHKYIPTSLDDIVLSWDIVNRYGGSVVRKKSDTSQIDSSAANQREKIQVLLVAAPKTKVEKYERLVRDSGFRLKSIEIESFSLVRSLVGNDPGNFVIVDIGSRVCNIILVERGVIKVNRNIDAGGRDMTRAISKSMNIDEARAEKLKVSGKNFLNQNVNVYLPVFDLIAAEVKRVLESHYKTKQNSKVDGVILSGGTAGIAGIDKFFSESLQLKVIMGNPFARVEYDSKLEPKINETKSQLSVCVGLALKGFEENVK